MRFISEHVPGAVREYDIANYFGRKIAIDASTCLYQFLVAIRSGADGQNMASEDGEATSHLIGMFYRTLRMLDAGIKPVYVFDGKPPELKGGELAKRREKREEAEADLKEAKEAGDTEEINKFTRRLVRVSKEQNAEAKRLLSLMGVPYVDAPGEAEATCAALARYGLVYGAGTEDMDALPFGAPRLIRNLTVSASKEAPIVEIDLAKVLEGLQLSMDEFIEMCVLFGCDYTNSIRGIGPQKAFEMIKAHRSIEEGVAHLNTEKNPVPEDFRYKEAIALFHGPDVVGAEDKLDLANKEPDVDGLIKFLCEEKGFQEQRVRNGIARLTKAKAKGTQQRLENFFTIIPKALTPAAGAGGQKRGAEGKSSGTKKARK
jgi:flap endonuclease-1